MTIMDHPNVLGGLALGMFDGKPFMVLDLLKSTLKEELPGAFGEVPFWTRWRGVRRWPLSRALDCGVQLASALHYVQEDAFPRSRILHRDIKPANIGFREDGRLVLFDFGLATLWNVEVAADGAEDERPRNLTGETGSLRYMAPEVALSKPYGPSAEVFSFASVVWEMGAHAKPFADTPPGRFTQVLGGGGRPPVPKKWPRELQELLSECWDLEPSRRPRFGEIVQRLQLVRDALPVKKGSAAKPLPVQ